MKNTASSGYVRSLFLATLNIVRDTHPNASNFPRWKQQLYQITRDFEWCHAPLFNDIKILFEPEHSSIFQNDINYNLMIIFFHDLMLVLDSMQNQSFTFHIQQSGVVYLKGSRRLKEWILEWKISAFLTLKQKEKSGKH